MVTPGYLFIAIVYAYSNASGCLAGSHLAQYTLLKSPPTGYYDSTQPYNIISPIFPERVYTRPYSLSIRSFSCGDILLTFSSTSRLMRSTVSWSFSI